MAGRQALNSIRTFAASASTAPVKPPIQVFGLEGRYATALYSAAHKTKTLEQVEKDLLTIQDAMKRDVKLREFMDSPVVSRKTKVEGVMSVAGKMGLTQPAANLLALLAENGRLRKLNGVVTAFATLMAARRGDLRCHVTTAKPLDEATKKELEGVLKMFAKQGENIMLELKVEPTIIGGMIVSIGDKYVDMSIASKVKKYSELMKASV